MCRYVRYIFLKLKSTIKLMRARILKRFLLDDTFTIISDSCWGGYIYQYLGLPYNTPFVGLFIFSPDFVIMLEDLERYLYSDLEFINASTSKYKEQLVKHNTYNKYPIGLLGGVVEVHFLHYASEEEAYVKWMRRRSRMNLNKIIIKLNDRDLFSEELLYRFKNTPFNRKVFLGSKRYIPEFCLKLKNENGDFINDEWNNFRKTTSVLSFINKILRA